MNSDVQYVQFASVASQSPLLDELLQRQLVEPVAEVRLDVDDLEAVRDRLLGLPVGDPARDLVREQEPEPDRDLAKQIRPSPRQIPPPDCSHRRHTTILTSEPDHGPGVVEGNPLEGWSAANAVDSTAAGAPRD